MSLFRHLFGKRSPVAAGSRRPRSAWLQLEALEDRSMPSTTNVFSVPGSPLVEQITSLGGNLYFTTNAGEIGRITPTGQITTNFAVGGEDLAAGPDGNLWTAAGNTVERITPSGTVTDFTIPTPNAEAESITAGPDGNLWFAETSVDQIGEINPTTGVIKEFPVSQLTLYQTPNFGALTAGPDGNFWFTEPVFYQIGRITPGGSVTDFALPTAANQPEQITAGPDGNVWFTLPGLPSSVTPVPDQIGRISPTGQVTLFTVPLAGGQPLQLTGITTGPDGNLYFNSRAGLGRITPSGQVTEFLSSAPGFGGITVGPDGNIWAAGNGTIEQLVLGATAPAAPTTTTLRTSANSLVAGQTQTLTATVTSSVGTPGGTVTFFDGSTALGNATLNASGQATLTVALGAGAHSLTASYTGTSAFAASTSAAVAESVSQAATTTTLSTSASSVATGQSVTFTATIAGVAPGSGMPTGTVTFMDGSVVLGTATVGAGGTATLSTHFSTTGSHTITAVYGGDGNFVGSTGQAITEQVSAAASPAATTTSLVASSNTVRRGQTVTFTAKVSGPAGTGTPTGTITFFVGNTAVATVTLDATGKARLTGSFSVTGKYTIRAVYSGDSNFAASSQSLVETVN